MYTFRYWALVIVAIICYVSASTFEPFLTPFSDQALDSPTMPDSNVVGIIGEEEMQLEKRQAATACPSSYYNCANIGAGNVCCANSQACALDNSGQAACCPYGSVCTGTVGGVVTGGSVPYGGSTRGIVAGGSTVAIPAGAIRHAKVPWIAQLLVGVCTFLRLL